MTTTCHHHEDHVDLSVRGRRLPRPAPAAPAAAGHVRVASRASVPRRRWAGADVLLSPRLQGEQPPGASPSQGRGSAEADRREARLPRAPQRPRHGGGAMANGLRRLRAVARVRERPPLSWPTSKTTSMPTSMPAARPTMSRPGDWRRRGLSTSSRGWRDCERVRRSRISIC